LKRNGAHTVAVSVVAKVVLGCDLAFVSVQVITFTAMARQHSATDIAGLRLSPLSVPKDAGCRPAGNGILAAFPVFSSVGNSQLAKDLYEHLFYLNVLSRCPRLLNYSSSLLLKFKKQSRSDLLPLTSMRVFRYSASFNLPSRKLLVNIP